jgi:hypothetical protein
MQRQNAGWPPGVDVSTAGGHSVVVNNQQKSWKFGYHTIEIFVDGGPGCAHGRR